MSNKMVICKKDLDDSDIYNEFIGIIGNSHKRVIKVLRDKDKDDTLEERLSNAKLCIVALMEEEISIRCICMLNMTTKLLPAKDARLVTDKNKLAIASRGFRFKGSLRKYSLVTIID